MKPSDRSENQPNPFSNTLKMMAYPLSVAIGWYYGHVTIRNKTYDRIKRYGGFDDILPNHVKNMEELVRPHGELRNITHEFAPLHGEFTGKISQRMRELGFKNTHDYMKGLHHNEKLEAALTAFTAAGITLGVILSIADSKTMLNMMNPEEKEQGK